MLVVVFTTPPPFTTKKLKLIGLTTLFPGVALNFILFETEGTGDGDPF